MQQDLYNIVIVQISKRESDTRTDINPSLNRDYYRKYYRLYFGKRSTERYARR